MRSREPDRLLKKLEDIENIMSRHEGAIEQVLSVGSHSSETALETLQKLEEVQRQVKNHEEIISKRNLEESAQLHVQGNILRRIEELECAVEYLMSAFLESKSIKEETFPADSNPSLVKAENDEECSNPDVLQYGGQVNSNTYEIPKLQEVVLPLQKVANSTSTEENTDGPHSGDWLPDERLECSQGEANVIGLNVLLAAQSEFQSKAQDLEKKIQFITMSLENTEQQEEHDDSEDPQENVTTKFSFHGGSIDWMKMQMNNMWKHFSGRCNMLSQNASIRDSMMEAESQRTNELKDVFTESAQNIEKRLTGIEEHVSELRSAVISSASVRNQIEINEIKRTLEPQKTNSDDLSAEIASLKQKLEDILAESVQGLEELAPGKEVFLEGILPGVISQTSVLNQIENEELKRTVESQSTDIDGSNGETASCERSLKDTLAESVQGLEELATGKEECIEDIQSEFISQTSVMSQIEIEELKRTVESQRTDVDGSNGEILSLKQKEECKDSQIDHERGIISLQKMTRSNHKSIEDRFTELMHAQEQEIQENRSKLAEMESKFQEMEKSMADIGISGPEINKDIKDVMDTYSIGEHNLEEIAIEGRSFLSQNLDPHHQRTQISLISHC